MANGKIIIETDVSTKKSEQQLKQLEQISKNAGNTIGNEISESAKKVTNDWNIAKNSYDNNMKEMIRLTQDLSDMQEALKVSESLGDNEGIAILNRDIALLQQEITKVSNNTDRFGIAMEVAGNKAQNISNGIKGAETSTIRLDKSMKSVDKSTAKVSKSTIGIGDGIDKGIKKLAKYGLALFSIRSIYQSLRNLSNKWLNSDDAGAKQVKANIDEITNALANALAPIITFITGLVVQLFGYFNAILKTFFGIDLMSKKLSKNTGSTAKGASKVTKELKKWTGSFDKADIASENIADNMDSASGGGGMDLPEAKIPTPDISGIVKAFDKIKKSFLNIWNSKEFQKALGNMKTIFTNTFNSLVSIGANVVDNIGKTFNLMSPHIERSMKNIANFYLLLLEDMANFTDEWLPTLTEKFNLFVDGIFETFNPLFEFMSQLWADIWGIILELWEEHGAGLLDKAGLMISNILDIWDKLWALVDTIITPILDVFKNVWNDTLKDTLKDVGSFMLEMWGYGMDLYNNFIAPIVGFLLDVFQPVWATVFGAAGGIITGVFNSVVGTIRSTINTIRDVIKGLVTFISGVFAGDWKKAWQGIVNIFDAIFGGIKNLVKIPINFIIDRINGFLRGLNKIKIPDWIPVVGGKGFSIPTIPRLAKGGVLRQETLNIAGEYAGARTNPEIVTPQNIMRDTMESVLKGMNLGGGGSETINLIWNNEKLATAQVDYEQTKGIQMNGGMTYEFI